MNVGSSVSGTIEIAGGVDWYKFQAMAGKTYTFSTQLGTLSDTVFDLYGADGYTVLPRTTTLARVWPRRSLGRPARAEPITSWSPLPGRQDGHVHIKHADTERRAGPGLDRRPDDVACSNHVERHAQAPRIPTGAS